MSAERFAAQSQWRFSVAQSSGGTRDESVPTSNPKTSSGRIQGISPPQRPGGSSRRVWLIGLVAVAVALSLSAVVFEVAHGPHSSSSNSRVLIAASQYDWLPEDSFDSVAFVVATNATVTGTLSDTHGLVMYLMTPDQYATLTRTGEPGAYTWSSGQVPSPTHYNLSLTIDSGDWNLVFFNPSSTVTSGVDFWSSVVETTG